LARRRSRRRRRFLYASTKAHDNIVRRFHADFHRRFRRVATVPARIVAANTRNDQDGYVLQPAKSGGRAIEEIFFGGTKYDLKIQPTGKSS